VPSPTVAEAVRLLRLGGRLVDVDWKHDDSPDGPPLEIRYSPAKATGILEGLGLRRRDQWEFGPRHYALLFERPAAPSRGAGQTARRTAAPAGPRRHRSRAEKRP